MTGGSIGKKTELPMGPCTLRRLFDRSTVVGADNTCTLHERGSNNSREAILYKDETDV